MIFLWTLAGSNLVINTITVGFILGQCSPVNKLWDDDVAGSCNGRLRNQHLAYFQGSKTLFEVNSNISSIIDDFTQAGLRSLI